MDVTFRVDDFSYKKLFHRRSYAKVTTILPKHGGLLQKNQNSCLLIFLTTRTHNTWASIFLSFFESFIIFFYFLKNLKGDPGVFVFVRHSNGAPHLGAPLLCSIAVAHLGVVRHFYVWWGDGPKKIAMAHCSCGAPLVKT